MVARGGGLDGAGFDGVGRGEGEGEGEERVWCRCRWAGKGLGGEGGLIGLSFFCDFPPFLYLLCRLTDWLATLWVVGDERGEGYEKGLWGSPRSIQNRIKTELIAESLRRDRTELHALHDHIHRSFEIPTKGGLQPPSRDEISLFIRRKAPC